MFFHAIVPTSVVEKLLTFCLYIFLFVFGPSRAFLSSPHWEKLTPMNQMKSLFKSPVFVVLSNQSI